MRHAGQAAAGGTTGGARVPRCGRLVPVEEEDGRQVRAWIG